MSNLFLPSLALLVAAGLCLFLSYIVWQRRSAPGAFVFAVLMMAVSFWSGAYAFELNAFSAPVKYFWGRLAYLGIATVPVLWLIFAFQYANRASWITRRTLAALLVMPAITLLLVWSNDAHRLFWSEIQLVETETYRQLIYSYGIGFYAFVVFSYLCILLGAIIILRSFFSSQRPYWSQALALLFGVGISWIVNAAYLLGLFPTQFPLDLTPFAFTLSGAAFTWGIFYFRIFDLVPIARNVILENMGDGILVMDTLGRIVEVNLAATGVLGISANRLIGQEMTAALRNYPELVDLFRSEPFSQREVCLASEDGCKYIDGRNSIIHNPAGFLIGRMLLLRDITMRKRAEQALVESEHRFRSFVGQSPDGIAVIDQAGILIEWNRTLAELTGITSQQVLGKSIFDALDLIQWNGKSPGQSRLALEFTLRDALQHKPGALSSMIEINYEREGRPVIVQNLVFQIFGEQRRWVGLVQREVTSHRQADASLRAMQEQHRQLLANVGSPVVALSRELQVAYCNDLYAYHAGIPAEQLVGAQIEKLEPAQKDTQMIVAYHKCLESGQAQVIDGWWRESYYRTRIYPTSWGLLAISDDITERIKTEEKLVIANERLEGLRQIDQAVLAAQSPGAIAEVALEHIYELIQATRVTFVLFTPEENELLVLAQRGGVPEQNVGESRRLPLMFDQLYLQLRQGKQVLLYPGENPEELPLIFRAIYSPETRTIVHLPLISQGELVGALILESAQEKAFAGSMLAVATELADSLAVAIQNALLLSETVKNLSVEARLNQVSRVIGSTLDLQTILRDVVRLAAELVQGDAAALGLLVPDRQLVELPYLHNLPAELGNSRIPNGQGVIWKVIESRLPLLLHEYAEHPQATAAWVNAGVRSFIGVPVEAGESLLGALGIFSLGETRRFTQREVSIARSIGRQAGLAIQNARLYEETQRLTFVDSLTGLFNRRYFYELGEREFRRAIRYSRPLAVILLDVDLFHEVNHRYGFEIGDQVLASLAELCRRTLRNVDVLGRDGGEEFIFLLPENDSELAAEVADRLRQTVEQTPQQTSAGPVPVTISLGIAGIDENCQSFTDLTRRADQALELSKQRGRNQVIIWQPE